MTDKQLFKKLKRRIKKAIGVTVYTKKTERQRAILKDLDYINRGMADFLIIDDWKTEKAFIHSINSFLKMENKLYNYKDKLEYKVGNMELIYKQIKLQHKIEEFNNVFKSATK